MVGDRASGKTTVATAVANYIARQHAGDEKWVVLIPEGPKDSYRILAHRLHTGIVQAASISEINPGLDVVAVVSDGGVAPGTTKLITLTNFEKEPYRG